VSLVTAQAPFKRLRATIYAFALSGLLACGGASPDQVNNAPLTADEARVFEHGADFIATLTGLEGKWREDWDRDLQTRVGSADFVGIITIHTVRTDVDPEQRVTHRLLGKVERTLYGNARGKELDLAVREGVPGFISVHDNLERLQGAKVIAYVRWFRTDVNTVSAHWHIAPASEEIVAETKSAIGQFARIEQGDGNARVIVHRQ
jgi:hypothetical protein